MSIFENHKNCYLALPTFGTDLITNLVIVLVFLNFLKIFALDRLDNVLQILV